MFCCFDWVKVPPLRPLQIPWPTHENHKAQEILQELPEHFKLWFRDWFFCCSYWKIRHVQVWDENNSDIKSTYLAPCQVTISNLASKSSLRPRILIFRVWSNHHFSNLNPCPKESYGGQRHWFLASLWKSNSSSTAPSHSVTLGRIGIDFFVSNFHATRLTCANHWDPIHPNKMILHIHTCMYIAAFPEDGCHQGPPTTGIRSTSPSVRIYANLAKSRIYATSSAAKVPSTQHFKESWTVPEMAQIAMLNFC